VVILQHPSEVKQSKGSVAMLALSLQSCEVIVAEDFNNNQQLHNTLEQYKGNVALLYPSDQARVLSESKLEENISADDSPLCVVLLDGTWKKAYRLYMVNRFLHELPHLMLPDNIKSEYRIRKTDKKAALSTLEACCHALALLEKNTNKYQSLLNGFIDFNQFQLSFKPSAL